MLEIPESSTIGIQAESTLTGKRIEEVFTASNPHKFAFYHVDPEEYQKLLPGQKIISASGHGMFVDLHCDEHICITIGDGTHMRYHTSSDPLPEKHQLLIIFEDGLFNSLKATLSGMAEKGGRDTEKDPCPNCGDTIIKEAYLGAAIYYCPTCQVF